ncbi:MAG: spiro-SPASM protein [Spirochaetales bacterium]
MKTLVLLAHFHRSPFLNHLWDGLTSTNRIRHSLQNVLPDSPCVEVGPFATLVEYFRALATAAAGFEEVVLASADTPFLRGDTGLELLELHRRYQADYTFADGFPIGLTPEIFHPRILAVLTEWSRDRGGPPTRESFFQVLSHDINRFDVETHLSPVDLRTQRLSLTANSARGIRLLERVKPWISLPIKEMLQKIASEGSLLRTLPATLLVQVTNGVRQLPVWSPQGQFDPSALTRRDFLEREAWNQLLDRMLAFAGDLTVLPAFWGEPSLHPQIAGLLTDALAKSGLSLCIETSGLGWNEADLVALEKVADGKIDWIVELDSLEANTYARLRGPGFEEALATTNRLLELFPGRVWPQTVRMRDNEAEMEAFYKFWKAKAGQVVLQKHNHFGGRLPSLKPADLSPWARHPCWHAARDLAIFLDGTTVVCRDDYERTQSLGNAYVQTPAELWQAGEALFASHLQQSYPPVCRNCDEYYTFFF